ncbi:FtsX-like permease family protein [Cellulomonas sp. Y8]|uniref:FtsX-like permease family protein n=1 Tax=Cellulomonas sp. Y8 TaxID=2591145 RepID=UPI003D755A52
MRTLLLGLKIQGASKVKIALLSLLLALSISVFLVVSELSDLSTEDLDRAIAADSGEAGTYVVSVTDDIGLTIEDFRATLANADALFRDSSTQVAEVLPGIESECPPYSALGEPTMLVLYGADGLPVDLPFGANLPAGTELCYSGQKVPESAAYLPTDAEQASWGPVLFIDRNYRDIVALASTANIEFKVRVVTGRTDDELSQVRDATINALQSIGARQAVDVRSLVTVVRVDNGQATREASRSVKVVYGVIGWGVLALGAISVLVAELIVVRQRTWFFGLVRALGGRGRHIAALVLVDVLTVVTCGLISALAITALAQPIVTDFVNSAFQVNANLLRAQRVPGLLVGAVGVVVIAALPPGIRAVREQPINVLEHSG